MSFYAMKAVVDAMETAGYHKAECWCLLSIARRADNSSKHVCVSIKALASALRKSESSIQRYIRAWISRGVLSRLRRGGNGMPTKYCVNLDELSTWASHRSQRNDRRFQHKTTGDMSITGQKRSNQRSQRNDLQSDNRSFRSDESSGDDRQRRRSPDDPVSGPKNIADILRDVVLPVRGDNSNL